MKIENWATPVHIYISGVLHFAPVLAPVIVEKNRGSQVIPGAVQGTDFFPLYLAMDHM